jgi:hypothetical protein
VLGEEVMVFAKVTMKFVCDASVVEKTLFAGRFEAK